MIRAGMAESLRSSDRDLLRSAMRQIARRAGVDVMFLRYAAQPPLLSQHFERVGARYFVPEPGLFANDGETITLTSLTAGVPTLLQLAAPAAPADLADLVGLVGLVDLVRVGGQVTQVAMDVPVSSRH